MLTKFVSVEKENNFFYNLDMVPEKLEKSDVEFFFNKYKHNIDQIFYLERKLINESYNYEKWEKLLSQNSELTREYFIENEKLLDDYLRPVIVSPEKLKSETLEIYLRHILFFLFENNIDFHLAEDLPKSVLKNAGRYDDLIQFEANLCLGISHTVAINSTEQETYAYFNRCFEIYPNFESAPDDNTRVHVAFCYCYAMMMFILYRSKNYKEFLNCYDHFERSIRTGNTAVYNKMWGEGADSAFHIDLILRHFRVYGIMMAGLSGFSLDENAPDFQEQLVSVNVLKNWLYSEFKLEEEESYINPMIFTYYYRDLYSNGQISHKDYHNQLLTKFNEIKKSPFMYSEMCFPQDDDPVEPQFARVLDKMKIFSRAFTANYILLPELLQLTEDLTLRKMIIEMIIRYYENRKYASKGFCSDKFLVEIVSLVGKYFETPEEFCSFVHTIFIHRQISTANHLSMLSNIVSLCVTSLIEKYPELFIVPGVFDSVEQVLEQKTNILIFLKNASILHDIGKLSCTRLVNLHFRKITSAEFSIIKEHPQNGIKIIENLEYLSKYKEIINGHHKFWNGTGGYPDDFELMYSKFKNYINLISICDAIDTATDLKGRNYIIPLTFDEISADLKSDNGVKYNPQIITRIFSDKQLVEELRYITGKGRNFISYKTYQQFILPNTKFSEDDEKSIVPYSKKFRTEIENFYKECYQAKDELIQAHIHQILEPENAISFILVDKKRKIFGIISGSVFTSLSDGSNYCQINEFTVLPAERRKGLGSHILNSAIPLFQEKGILNLKVNVSSEFSASSFFWIEGFVPCKQISMEKHLI